MTTASSSGKVPPIPFEEKHSTLGNVTLPALYIYQDPSKQWCLSHTKPNEFKPAMVAQRPSLNSRTASSNQIQLSPRFSANRNPVRVGDNVIFFIDCDSHDTTFYIYDLPQSGELKTSALMRFDHESLFHLVKKIEYFHLPDQCYSFAEGWIKQLFEINNLHKKITAVDLERVTYTVITVNCNIQAHEKRLLNANYLKNLEQALVQVVSSLFKLPKNRKTTFELISKQDEAYYELTAAKKIFDKSVSSVISIQETGIKMSNGDGIVVVSDFELDKLDTDDGTSKVDVWNDRLLHLARQFKFGLNCIFISGFIFAIRDLMEYLKTADARIYGIVEAATSEHGHVDHKTFLHEVMTSVPVQKFIETQKKQKSGSSIYFLQQIIVCCEFDPKTRIQIRNVFNNQKLTFSVGWCLSQSFSNENETYPSGTLGSPASPLLSASTAAPPLKLENE